MIFFDTIFWRVTLPVEPLLEALFIKNGREAEYQAKVRFMDDVDEIVEFFVVGQQASAQKTKNRFEALGWGR